MVVMVFFVPSGSMTVLIVTVPGVSVSWTVPGRKSSTYGGNLQTTAAETRARIIAATPVPDPALNEQAKVVQTSLE